MNAFYGNKSLDERMALRKAISDSGYSFIRLNLINPAIKRIQAIELVVPERTKGENGLTAYVFTRTSGPLQFAPNEANDMMVADVFDCPGNRKFLASHTAYNFWEIDDKKVREEIQALADEITARAIKKQRSRVPVEKVMSDEELERQLATLSAEKSLRTIGKMDAATVKAPPKTPKIEDVKPEAKSKAKAITVES
jgi:hypothetical protein